MAPKRPRFSTASATTCSGGSSKASTRGSDASDATSNLGETDDDMLSGKVHGADCTSPPRRSAKGKSKGSPGKKGSPYRTSMVIKNVKDRSLKDCKLCRVKITDLDPAFNDGVTTVLWAARQNKGINSRCCRRVHLKKHKHMPLKQLLDQLSQDADTKASFEESQRKEVHLTTKKNPIAASPVWSAFDRR